MASTTAQHHRLIILGSGPAGYTAASLDVTFTISESLITPVVANSSLTTLAETGASSHLNWSLPLIGMGFVLAVVGVLILRIARQRIH